jgi:hypothetical protein
MLPLQEAPWRNVSPGRQKVDASARWRGGVFQSWRAGRVTPLHANLGRQAAWIAICFGSVLAGVGTVTFSTPLARLALIWSGWTPSGNAIERENEP